MRSYEPGFAVTDMFGSHLLVETKGREDVDVTHKDRAARTWCENATLPTGTAWDYVKVPQGDFERLRPADLADLRLAFGGGSPWIRT